MAMQKRALNFGNTSSTRVEKSYVESDYWIHVGLRDSDGNIVTLAKGMPIDGQEPEEIKTSSQEWAQRLTNQNALLAFLQESLPSLELDPGEECEMEDLVVTIRRRKAKAVTSGISTPTFKLGK